MSNLNLAVGVVVALGGVMGYVKQQSVPSLLAGGGSGLLYIVARYDVEAETAVLPTPLRLPPAAA